MVVGPVPLSLKPNNSTRRTDPPGSVLLCSGLSNQGKLSRDLMEIAARWTSQGMQFFSGRRLSGAPHRRGAPPGFSPRARSSRRRW
jgi:hypothetical protein